VSCSSALWGSRLLTIGVIRDFGLTEAAYVVVRLLRRFETITLLEGEDVQVVGQEKQSMTLVIATEEGCPVIIK
jgi:hypothetical protein